MPLTALLPATRLQLARRAPPPLGGDLSPNPAPAAEDPPPTLRDMPDDIRGLILEKVIEGIAPGDMCGTRLYALCLSIRGSGGCDNPDDDVWRLACARLRVTRSVGTWRETFDALRRLDPGGRATLAGLMQGEDPYGPVEEHAFRVVYGFYEGEELVCLKWYHPFASYLEERWYRSRGILEWYLERHQRFLKEGVARLWSAAIINRLSCIVGFLLNTVDDIVDTDHFHGPDLHFYERWRDEFSRMSPDEARSLDGGWTLARIRDCGPSLDGVLCWTALMYATSQGYTDIVEMLIAAHADVNVTSNHPLLRDEETVLMLADRGAHDDIAALLLNAGANDERRGVYGVDAIFASYLEEWGSLEWFCWAARHGDELDKQRACRLIRWSAPEPLEDDPNEWSAISDGAPLMCRKTHARKKEHLRTKRIDDQPRKKGRPVLKMHLPRKGKALMEMELEFSE